MANNTIEHGIAVREQIKSYIISYITEHGYAPTVREIAVGVGLKSNSSVHSHLLRMFNEGMLETDAEAGSPRAIRVPGYELRKKEESQNEIKRD